MGFSDQSNDLRMVSRIIHSIFLYAACTEAGFVKVGISGVPFERIYQIHLGSPSPVRAAQWVYIGSQSMGFEIERTMKKEWAKRRTRGEWYQFDYSNPSDKRDFHDTLSAVVEVVTGEKPKWERMGPERVSEMIRTRGEEAPVPKGKHPWRANPLVLARDAK